jgi:hypothetical protein
MIEYLPWLVVGLAFVLVIAALFCARMNQIESD